MNRYLRAVGFTTPPRRREIYRIIELGIAHPAYRAYTTNDDDEESLLAQFDIEVGDGFGVSFCGQFDGIDEFHPDYYYPYLDSETISSTEELTVEARVDNDSYAGICDDLKIGAELIFRVRNGIEYVKNQHTSFLPLENTSVTLTALSLEGTILLPLHKSQEDIRRKKDSDLKRRKLLNAARSGDEGAWKDITVENMDVYSNLMNFLPQEDIYTLVESYFMPHGAECELYSIMGEITASEERRNRITQEKVIVLTIDCSGLLLDVAINEKDLSGEPQIGRRFRGTIWLQGRINFPIRSEFPDLKNFGLGGNSVSNENS